MSAVALAVAGWGPQSEDIVQDASLAAITHLGGLRDPDRVGPWLCAITRNQARMWLRTRAHADWGSVPVQLPAIDADPAQLLEQASARDRIWHAVAGLTEPLQLVVLLRYFSDVTSYDQIAHACELPIGTVRSRLYEARRQLLSALTGPDEAPQDGASSQGRAHSEWAVELISATLHGEFRHMVEDRVHPSVRIVGPQGQRSEGRGLLVHIMETDLNDGVRQRVATSTGNRRFTLMSCDLLSPSWAPDHCPPGVLWVLRHDDHDTITSIRLYHPAA